MSTREKASSKFHDRLASSAASQVHSVYAWLERKAMQTFRAGTYAAGSVVFVNMLIVWTIVLYYILYWMFIPAIVHFETPLYFDVDPSLNGPVRFDLPRETPFEFPVASVHFASYDQQWLEVRDENLTVKRLYPGRHDNPLYLGELYDVSVHLTLPETPQNLDIGVFMVETELLFAASAEVQENNHRALARSRRPVSIPYRTWISSLARDVLLLPVRFLMGWYAPERAISIVTIEDWKEDWNYTRLPTGVKVTLSDPRLNIKHASAHFDLKLSGFRYWMYYWFWTTFVLTVALLTSMQSGAAFLTVLYKKFAPATKKRVKFQFSELFSDDDDDDGNDDDRAGELEEGEDEDEEEVEIVEEGSDIMEEEGAYEDDFPPAPYASVFEEPAYESESPSLKPRRLMTGKTASVSESPSEVVVGGGNDAPPIEGDVRQQSLMPTPLAVVEGEEEKQANPSETLQPSTDDVGSASSGEKSRGSSESDVILVGDPVAEDEGV